MERHKLKSLYLSSAVNIEGTLYQNWEDYQSQDVEFTLLMPSGMVEALHLPTGTVHYIGASQLKAAACQVLSLVATKIQIPQQPFIPPAPEPEEEEQELNKPIFNTRKQRTPKIR